jgi:hypothetical protein
MGGQIVDATIVAAPTRLAQPRYALVKVPEPRLPRISHVRHHHRRQ